MIRRRQIRKRAGQAANTPDAGFDADFGELVDELLGPRGEFFVATDGWYGEDGRKQIGGVVENKDVLGPDWADIDKYPIPL